MFYSLLRPLLFRLAPESAHHLALQGLNIAHRLRLANLFTHSITMPKDIMGLTFSNPVGLAAGLDKNGDYIDALAKLGFGFIEVGTVTPLPQPGNPQPRLFRLPQAEAIINRMGFNNKGIDYLIARIKSARYKGILGINIGKNASTPIENAKQDYLICLKKAFAYASYITINISSPNTSGLRNLQHGVYLQDLLTSLKTEQNSLQQRYQKRVPLVVKVAPDLSEAELIELADTFKRCNIEGVIATNTTIARTGVTNLLNANEQGGLSGRPLTGKSTGVLTVLRRELDGKIPLIAAGGIMTAADAQQKLDAGADLIQLYTGLIYHGPKLIQDCLLKLARF